MQATIGIGKSAGEARAAQTQEGLRTVLCHYLSTAQLPHSNCLRATSIAFLPLCNNHTKTDNGWRSNAHKRSASSEKTSSASAARPASWCSRPGWRKRWRPWTKRKPLLPRMQSERMHNQLTIALACDILRSGTPDLQEVLAAADEAEATAATHAVGEDD